MIGLLVRHVCLIGESKQNFHLCGLTQKKINKYAKSVHFRVVRTYYQCKSLKTNSGEFSSFWGGET